MVFYLAYFLRNIPPCVFDELVTFPLSLGHLCVTSKDLKHFNKPNVVGLQEFERIPRT